MAEREGLHKLNLSGTKFRKALRAGEDIPEWFAFKSVVQVRSPTPANAASARCTSAGMPMLVAVICGMSLLSCTQIFCTQIFWVHRKRAGENMSRRSWRRHLCAQVLRDAAAEAVPSNGNGAK